MPRRLLHRRQANVLCAFMFLCWCTGQLALDRTWLTGLMLYLPSPILLLVVAAVAVWNHRAGAPRLSAVAVVAMLPVLFVVIAVENQFWPPEPLPLSDEFTTAPSYTLVHWNVASGRLGWQRVSKKLNEQRADIYVLSEPPGRDQLRQWLTEDLGIEFRCEAFGSIFVAAKGQIRDDQWLVQTPQAQIVSLIWNHDGTTLHLFAVDLISDLDQHRDPLLRELNELIRIHQPDVIVGDFNAPRRSFRLQNLPPGFRHAYDVAGGGLGYTWPVPIPLYALDQCIVGRDLDVLKYDLHTSFSDHRLQRLEFRSHHGFTAVSSSDSMQLGRGSKTKGHR